MHRNRCLVHDGLPTPAFQNDHSSVGMCRPVSSFLIEFLPCGLLFPVRCFFPAERTSPSVVIPQPQQHFPPHKCYGRRRCDTAGTITNPFIYQPQTFSSRGFVVPLDLRVVLLRMDDTILTVVPKFRAMSTQPAPHFLRLYTP